MRLIAATLPLLLLLAACGSPDRNNDGKDVQEDSPIIAGWDLVGPDDGAAEEDLPPGTYDTVEVAPGAWTIQVCQTMEEGRSCPDGSDFIDLAEGVVLSDVVAATKLFSVSDDLDGFFANDGTGGANSGLLVVFDRGMVSEVSLGAHLDVSGDLLEFYCNTQLNASSVTITQAAATPPPAAAINPGDVVSAGGSLSEDYEGCLVTLANVDVIQVDSVHNTFSLQGGLLVDDLLYPYKRPGPGCTFTSITGVVQYSFGEYVLLPRSAADLQNDGSLACGGAALPTPETVYDLQNSETSKTCSGEMFVEGGSASFTDVVVTSPTMSLSNGKFRGVHVQEKGGGAWSGILVLWETDGSPPTLALGDVLDVSGDWTEYYCLSELIVEDWSVKEPWTGSFHPDAVDPALLGSGGAAAEPWEGVLVSVEDVTIGSVNEYGDLILDGSGLVVDHQFTGGFEIQAGASFSSITGVVYYSFEKFRLLPRSLDDLLK